MGGRPNSGPVVEKSQNFAYLSACLALFPARGGGGTFAYTPPVDVDHSNTHHFDENKK